MYLFEIHLTVNPLTNDRINDFENLCQKLGGKAILIELPMGEHTQQPMMTYVKQADDITEILADIDNLKPKFLNQGFEIIRTKIEIPAEQYDAYIKEFPNTKGYFEWHGKVQFNFHDYGLKTLYYIPIRADYQAHISKNALKNQENIRFITCRNKDKTTFYRNIRKIIKQLKVHRYTKIYENHQLTQKDFLILLKEQAEYCIYDDKITLDKDWDNLLLNNIALEKYQAMYPNIQDINLITNLYIFEGLIRRTAKLNFPFMLKGSLVTRQYFDNPNQRFPFDIDFVCLTHLSNEETATQTLNDWLLNITRLDLNDGLYFVDFSENTFWRQIDYAMHDDFPTVSTDLICYIGKQHYEILLEVSFNLPIPFPPVPLTYKTPIDEFIYPKTTPLSLQIAWKIHQTIVRPRPKDIYDLTYLVKRVDNQQVIDDTIFALLQECEKDNIDIERVKKFFNYSYIPFADWESYHFIKGYFPLIPDNNQILFAQFKESMQNAGFILEHLNLSYSHQENCDILENIEQSKEHKTTFLQNLKDFFK